MIRRRHSVWLAGAAVLLLTSLYSQRTISTREQRRMDDQADEPGGTTEEKLWEVLILAGVGETTPSRWDGDISVADGEIFQIEGYRFVPPDRILPQGGWRLGTQTVEITPVSSLASNAAAMRTRAVVPKGILVRGSGTASTTLKLNLRGEAIGFRPAAMTVGSKSVYLGGAVEIWRVPPETDLSGTELRQHDFPAIAAGSGTDLWAVWTSYHDQRQELGLRLLREDHWSRLIPVARASEDLWRPQVAVDGAGKPWLIWAQRVNENWDIYAMARDSVENWGAIYRLSRGAQPDTEPQAAAAPDGTIYVVWQSLENGNSNIRLSYLRNGTWSPEVRVTEGTRHDWEPAVAAGKDGRAWIVWDRYNASYDVLARSFSPRTGLSPEIEVAATPRFEAHATVAVDRDSRPWVAWEEGGADWGKDLGRALGSRPQGSPLGDRRKIGVACLDHAQWRQPSTPEFHDALAPGSSGVSNPLLHIDPNGSVWLAFRRRYGFKVQERSVYWESYLARLEGDHWSAPILLPHSWARPSARLGLASTQSRLWAFWTNENRQFAMACRPRQMRVVAGSLPIPPPAPDPRLEPYRESRETAASPAAHPDEPGDVQAMRAHTVRIGGETLHLLRGELHRHTELSQDFGGLGDGTLPEFYRYSIDAADLDFAASTDHQGGGVDYWNFITQLSAEMYHFPPRFTALFGYERNMPEPHGHRNILHTRRNYAIVPFFQRISPKFLLPDTAEGELVTQNSAEYGGVNEDDTKLLYEELRKTGGLSIPHTTAGANEWRDNDPNLDTVMEVYQGARDSSEHKGAPRSHNKSDFGYAWDAWRKGYRIGLIASSDHYSTHISYAMVYATENSRQAVLDAIRRRRTYGATDNILLEFWWGDRFMGEDFTAARNEPIRIKVRGTAAVAKVELIRDATYIHTFTPAKRECEFTYKDAAAAPGPHWYYVRVEQQDGQLAWGSPIWVRLP